MYNGSIQAILDRPAPLPRRQDTPPSKWGSRWILFLALAVGLSGFPGASIVQAQDWQTLTTRRQVSGERDLEVNVEFAAGRLRIEPATAGELYHATFRYDSSNFEPVAKYDAGVLRLGLEGGRKSRRNIREGSQLTLGLGADLPLDLNIAFGAVEAELELGGLRIRNAEIATGASDTKLNFSRPNRQELDRLEMKAGAASCHASGLGNANARRITFEGGVGDIVLEFGGEWQGDTRVEISMGVGSLTLRLPRDLGVRVERETFLVAFDPQGLVKRGSGY
jgi:hypothetical protein